MGLRRICEVFGNLGLLKPHVSPPLSAFHGPQQACADFPIHAHAVHSHLYIRKGSLGDVSRCGLCRILHRLALFLDAAPMTAGDADHLTFEIFDLYDLPPHLRSPK